MLSFNELDEEERLFRQLINPNNVEEVRDLLPEQVQLLGAAIFKILDEADKRNRKDLYNYAMLYLYELAGLNCPHPYPDSIREFPPRPSDESDPEMYERYIGYLNSTNYECPICGALIIKRSQQIK